MYRKLWNCENLVRVRFAAVRLICLSKRALTSGVCSKMRKWTLRERSRGVMVGTRALVQWEAAERLLKLWLGSLLVTDNKFVL